MNSWYYEDWPFDAIVQTVGCYPLHFWCYSVNFTKKVIFKTSPYNFPIKILYY